MMELETGICPVDVISVCTVDGQIRPLRMRVEDRAKQLLRVDIDEVVSVRQIQYVGVESLNYLCRGHVGHRPWVFELRYMIRTHSWCLLRRLN